MRGSKLRNSRRRQALMLGTLGVAALQLVACSATDHRQDVDNATGDEITVGTVQREIRVGMSGAQVAEILGSPNIVSTDEERREVWIWDKVSTDVTYSRSNGNIVGLIFGGSGGGIGAGSKSAGAASTSQRTLTVIVNFDEDMLVRDFKYRTSRF